MDWVDEFYSVTGAWWGEAEANVRDIDRARSRYIKALSPAAGHVLELGCGYGSTAVALAKTGLDVVAIDLSDRIEHASKLAGRTPNARFIRGDFYTVELSRTFDVVCYWDGFGIGDDADQRRLLERIATDWLDPDGVAIVEVFHPSGWRHDHGLDEIKEAAPDLGYSHRLGHRRSYDDASSRATDLWWEIGSTQSFSQSLRCYEPDEFQLLAASAGLAVTQLTDSLDPPAPMANDGDARWSYIAVLTPKPHASNASTLL